MRVDSQCKIGIALEKDRERRAGERRREGEREKDEERESRRKTKRGKAGEKASSEN